MPGQNQRFEQDQPNEAAKPSVVGLETPAQPEKGREGGFERPSEVAAPRPLQRVPVKVVSPAQQPAAVIVPPRAQKSETLRNIEAVMEQNLAEVYKAMAPDVKKEFKKKGEETASQIEKMLYQVKVQTKKIFHLLFDWLKIIPGVNKFFLEQEAKLKTDEIMKIKEDLEKNHGKVKSL